jgi:hypothetical protein
VTRACAAIHADEVNRERRKRCERGVNLRAVEHRPENFDGHLRDDRDAPSCLLKLFEDGGKRGFGLQQVLAGFDHEKVNPAIEEATHLFGISRFQIFVGDVAECGQLRSRPH